MNDQKQGAHQTSSVGSSGSINNNNNTPSPGHYDTQYYTARMP